MKLRMACAVVGFVSLVLSLAAQTAGSSAVAVEVPPLIQFSNVATDSGGNTLSGVVSITFSLYAAQQGGEPLWTETQNNVQLDSTGHYSVQLGITKPGGVPTALFTSGEARWLGVRIGEQAEQPRVLLLSVPYALKAGDAATIGGLPPSAFVLASPQALANVAEPAATQSVPPPTASDVTTSGGTVNYLPLWDATSDITSSVVFQSGKKIGINTATPASTLDINGGNTVRGTLTLPAAAKATASAGADSQPLKFQASSFSSTTSTAVNQSFQWQAEPYANDTAGPSGTLNLLYGLGATAPSETGLHIASDGVITFASGQTFPGTGGGSVTSVGSGAGLTGGPITSSGALSIANGGVSNAMLANPSLTVSPGAGLAGGGAVALGTSTTLSVDSTKVPLLASANAFTGTQTINGNLFLPGTTTGGTEGVISIGVPILHNYGVSGSYNIFLGYSAGNFTNTGTSDTAIGTGALGHITSGSSNTASGLEALDLDTTGSHNTASGVSALYYNQTGSFNTAMGYSAGPGSASTSLSNSTAIGADATVSASNALILGQTTAGSPGTTWVNVGIGTAVPRSALEANVGVAGGLGPTITLTNSAGGTSSSDSLDFNTYAPFTTGTYNPAARIAAVDAGNYSDNIVFQSNVPGAANSGLQTNMTITPGQVGIGKTPAYTLDVNGTSNFLGSLNTSGVPDYGEAGIIATGAAGIPLGSSAGGDGIDAYPGIGHAASNGFAGNFSGNLNVTGAITAGTKDFKIDHPLDPANKYLVHASVESSEMKNIYDGNVTTDSEGRATVQLPEWFEALNKDFRYQLTVIGQFAQAIVARKIENHQFEVRTSAPNVEVSWQVTGVRQDAFAKANPLVVEQEKEPQLRGYYIHPELYAAPEEKQIEWARHPQQMEKLREIRAQQLTAVQERGTAQGREATRAETMPLAVPPGVKGTPAPAVVAPVVRSSPVQKQAAPRN